ncbi:MAG: hypothetical protein M0C28_45070 [Candidatus Moduliflexus flocculans]|nr:hypothetical protein [Candidatus Moduliflexus flocculans]
MLKSLVAAGRRAGREGLRGQAPRHPARQAGQVGRRPGRVPQVRRSLRRRRQGLRRQGHARRRRSPARQIRGARPDHPARAQGDGRVPQGPLRRLPHGPAGQGLGRRPGRRARPQGQGRGHRPRPSSRRVCRPRPSRSPRPRTSSSRPATVLAGLGPKADGAAVEQAVLKLHARYQELEKIFD